MPARRPPARSPARAGSPSARPADSATAFADVYAAFRKQFRDAESRLYLATHERRYRRLLEWVGTIVAELAAGARVLDVGPAYQTALIRALYPEVVVDTVGFADPRFPPRDGERHLTFDLNEAHDRARWPDVVPYDLVVFAEVVEHLHASPAHVLRLLASLTAANGRVIVQTPNAASLMKRLKLLLGRQPFEPIRENRDHPGHFREYTLAELVDLARESGFEIVASRLENYFLTGSRKNTALVALDRVVPPRLRERITLDLRKPFVQP